MYRLFLLVLGVCLVGTTAFAQTDQVFGLKGTPNKGTVTRMSKTEVILDASGAERTFPVNEVRKVTYADDPADLDQARNAILSGRLEDAQGFLKKIDPASVKRNVVLQDLMYYRAYVDGKLALQGGTVQAITAAHDGMLAFVRANANSFHFFEAAELLGDLKLAAGDFATATNYYGSITKAAPWPEFRMRASILAAKALMAQENYPEASKRYDEIMVQDVASPEANRQKKFATAGKAMCLAEAGDGKRAVGVLEQMITDNDPADKELFARIYNALGRCYVKLDQPKDALLAYLHTDVMFYADPDAHAEALYYLARLWNHETIRKSDRAVDAKQLLTDRYGTTVWARKK